MPPESLHHWVPHFDKVRPGPTRLIGDVRDPMSCSLHVQLIGLPVTAGWGALELSVAMIAELLTCASCACKCRL